MKSSAGKLTPLRSFVTGSHAYGIPNEDSDVDLVVLVTEKDMERLMASCPDLSDVDKEYMSGAYTQSLRFGKLNLLVCTDERAFDVWRRGTRLLKKQKP